MHDLVHDLAQFVAEELCCITTDNCVTTLPERIYHFSDYRHVSNSIPLHQVKSLRTYLFPWHYGGELSPNVLKHDSLRVLHLRLREELPSSIGNLKYLRYLNLTGSRFKTLAESVCKLWNLQILKLDFCPCIQNLPNNLIHLKAVQQLSLYSYASLSSLAPEIGKLTSIRRLSTYIVGEKRGFLLGELGPLKLKGSLHILHLEKMISIKDAKDANMSSKQLNMFWLSWTINEESELQENVEQILEVLQPNTQLLQTLCVVGYKGANFPQRMSSPSLKYLSRLHLWHCGSYLQLPTLGKLPSLKSLMLTKLPSLIRLSREDEKNMFPSLSSLHISECPKFLAEEVLLQGLHFLKHLTSKRCPKFTVSARFQCLTCLEDLWIERCTEVEGLHDALQHMTVLKKLHLSAVPNLESLPDCFGNMPSLRRLYIENCDKLMCLPTSLSISNLEWLTFAGRHPELEKRCHVLTL